MYLIEKYGLYYRPNSQGYTGLKSEAGLYSFDVAACVAGPNGPDDPRDGIEIWLASEAPEYSSRCPWDVRIKDQAYKQGWNDAMAALKGERDDL